MTTLSALWLPLLLSSVFVFLVSSIIHMVLPWHKGDYGTVPDQDRFMDAVRPFAIPPGDYMVPRPADMKDYKTPEFAARIARGPVMVLTVMPNAMMSMGRNFVLWFLYIMVTGLLGAYIASRALAPGADYLAVFRYVACVSFAGYALGLWQMAIWYRRGWALTAKATFDGLIYALVTAGTFGWLWPR